MPPTPEQSAAGYRRLWTAAKVLPGKRAAAEAIARKIIAHRAPYEAVEKKTGVPWFMVGAIHNREASMNFACVLHNGEKIIGTGRKTKLVPAGRGPFPTWEAAAIDALTMPPHSLHRVVNWTLERILYETEKYNGWGYLGKCNSPYLWSWTNQYSGGKYIADHVFSRTAMDVQAGVVAIFMVLAEMDAGVAKRLGGAPADSVKPVPGSQIPDQPQNAPVAPGTPLPMPGAAPTTKQDAKDLGIGASITAAVGTAWQTISGSGGLRVAICLAAAFAIYWFVVRPVLRRLDALKEFYDRADLVRIGLLTRWQLALKGIKTKLWSWFLGLVGPLLGILQYADVVDLSTILPPLNGISAAIYVPVMLMPLIGFVTNELRKVSTTPVGETDLTIAEPAQAEPQPKADPPPAKRQRRKPGARSRAPVKRKIPKRKAGRR